MLITWPILVVDIVLVLTSIVLALFILLHKSRGGGMSDLFGGGMTTGMSGTSVAERNLDKITLAVGGVWLASIFGLLVLYAYFPEIGSLEPAATTTPAASSTSTPSVDITAEATASGDETTSESSESAEASPTASESNK